MQLYRFDALGTVWEVGFDGTLSDSVSDDLAQRVKEIIISFGEKYSRFTDTSLVAKWSNTTGEFELDAESLKLFKFYFDLYISTQGRFTPLIGQVLNEAGYDKNYSFQPQTISTVQKLHSALELHGNELIIKEKVQLDFGGIGKGYVIDKVKNSLLEHGIQEFVVNGGGDFYYANSKNKSIKIGLEHPLQQGEVIGSIEITNQSLCGSSGNRRKWSGYHHIIDPLEKSSSNKILASWVLAPTTLVADALSTCLFLVEPHVLTPHYSFEYLILNTDMTVQKSQGFNADIFYKTHGYA